MRGAPAITSLAALAGEAAEAPLRKLIGELGAAIAASGSCEATVAPVTAAASTGSQHTAPTGQAQHAPGEASPCNQASRPKPIFATHPAA